MNGIGGVSVYVFAIDCCMLLKSGDDKNSLKDVEILERIVFERVFERVSATGERWFII